MSCQAREGSDSVPLLSDQSLTCGRIRLCALELSSGRTPGFENLVVLHDELLILIFWSFC